MKSSLIRQLSLLSLGIFVAAAWIAIQTPQVNGENGKTASPISYSLEAWDHYADKNYDEATKLFQKEAELYPDWCDPHDGLGWCALQEGNFRRAQEHFTKSLELYAYYPNSLAGMAEVNAWRYRRFNRAWGHYYAGNLEKAIAVFEEILQNPAQRLPKEEIWRVHSGLGWTYFASKDYDKAIEHFREVLKAPNQAENYDTLKGLGFAYFEKKDWDNALENLQKSLMAVPDQTDVLCKIGWIYNKKDNMPVAIAQFEKAKAINPYLVEPYRGLAWCHYDKQDFQKAKDFFVIAIKIYPGYAADASFKEALRGRKEWHDMYSTLGWSYYTYGAYAQAAEAFQDGIKAMGQDADASRGLGYSLYKLAKYDQAIEALQQSLAQNPDLAPVSEYITVPGTIATYLVKSDAQSTLAWACYFKGEYNKAIKNFQEVVAKHPDWIDAQDGLGWSYFMKKDNEKAEAAFKEALRFNPSYADALNGLTAINQIKYGRSGLGWTYYYQGNFKAALEQFQGILKGKDPNYPKDQFWSIHSGIGWSYYWLGEFDKAQKAFEESLRAKPDNVDAIVGLGYVHFKRKSYTKAIENLNEALKIAPNNYEALTTMGWSCYHTKEYAQGVENFKNAIAINPYLVDPYFGLGMTYYRMKKLSEAKEVLGTAIDIYPDYVMTDEFKEILEKPGNGLDLHSRLGWSYYFKGLYDKASNMFAAELKNKPDSRDGLLGLGSIYYQQGDYKSAISKLEPLLAEKPATEKGWLMWSNVLTGLGWSYFYTGDYEKALAYFQQLLQMHKDDNIYAEPYSGIGWCLLKKGDKNGAKENFLTAVDLVPGYVSAVNGLASPELE